MAAERKTIAFFGASTGVGLSVLKHTLTAGHRCIALCRTPSKLTDILPQEANPNLEIIQGNAHDVETVSKCLTAEEGKFVDAVVSTIGTRPALRKMSEDELKVCTMGMSTLITAINQLRSSGATGRPHIIVCSTTGISRFGRDVPLALAPLYHVLLKIPHKDKKAMEDQLIASNENYTIFHPTLLTSGASEKEVRVGVEDVKTGRESAAIGYTISREDAGKWIADNTVLRQEQRYLNKIVMMSY